MVVLAVSGGRLDRHFVAKIRGRKTRGWSRILKVGLFAILSCIFLLRRIDDRCIL